MGKEYTHAFKPKCARQVAADASAWARSRQVLLVINKGVAHGYLPGRLDHWLLPAVPPS